MVTRAGVIAALCALAGCSIFTDSFEVDGFSGDPFPIDVDTTTGAIRVGVEPEGSATVTGLIDLLSPFTIMDHGPTAVPSISYPNIVIDGAAGPGGPLDLPRATLDEPQLLALHPCDDSVETCTIGPEGSDQPFTAILGADSLAGDDIRLDLASSQISILANVAGDEEHRSIVCDAVFPSPYTGGGTAIINGTELDYDGRRITIGTCVAFDPDPNILQSQRGVDMLFVASTAIGISILGTSAYERYRTFENDTPPDVDALPTATVVLPSGPVTGHVATLPRLALVAFDASTPRGPCRDDYLHHLLTLRDCNNTEDCPCKDGGGDNSDLLVCSVPGITELEPPDGFPMLVIDDADPTLQALSTELPPDQTQVDGIFGTSLLSAFEMDADFPHDRVLTRCAGQPNCSTRPEFPDEAARPQVQNCIGSGFDFGFGSGSGSGTIP